MTIKTLIESEKSVESVLEAVLNESVRVFSNFRGGSVAEARVWLRGKPFAAYDRGFRAPDPVAAFKDLDLSRQRRLDLEQAVIDEARSVDPRIAQKLRSGELSDAFYYNEEWDQVALWVQSDFPDTYEILAVESTF